MSIKTLNLFFSYFPKNKKMILHDLNVEITENSFTAVLGKTGSGKSTFIQTLNGLLLPTSGEVHVNDYVITSNKKKNKNIKDVRKHVGVVFQFPEYQLFEETVIKDVAFGPKNFGCSEEESINRAKKALSLVSLGEKFYERSPFELSGGEKRKVALAGILAIEPEVIIFDEPTAGLDNKSTDELMNLLLTLKENGKTIVIVSHDMNIVYEYADNTLVFEDGHLVFSGSPEDLFFNSDAKNILELPNVVKCINYYKNKHPNFDYKNIKNVKDLLTKIKGGVSRE